MNTPESMQQLEKLFHEAVGLGPLERAEFMSRARKSNPELAAAVESLIAAHEQPDSLIDSPAFEAAAEMIADTQPALVAGQVVGHYQIVAPLGKGGMGEVYLASDAKLARKVALKLLPTEFTNHKERLRRFIQEAKTASSLNHPNIITIYEIGETEGAHFIATEFIDGQTLKQLAAHTRMTLPEILDVSMQAADALQAAHAAGIVHRDIKPENIMLRPDGYVKILDFGLAKLSEKSDQSKTAGSEIDTRIKTHTNPGTVLGTVKYMSPEQARGQVLDQRTDVFSLGVVIYEMAAGRMPFTGATNIDTLVSILEKEPPPLDLTWPEVPAEFQRIVSKALRKDREERYQTIKDLLIDLKSLKEELAFAHKLERSRPGVSVGSTSPPTATPAPTDQTSVVATAGHPAAVKIGGHKRLVVPLALVVVVLGALVIGGAVLWRRGGSTPAISAPAKTAERALIYWITVQKYRNGRPFEDPFRLAGEINFEKDYRVRLNISSPQSGYLYILNEGPSSADGAFSFVVLFPSTTANGGLSYLAENQRVEIPEQSWITFDAEKGTEKLWVVFSANAVPELDAVKQFANPKDRGLINDAGLNGRVQEFLKIHSGAKATIEKDDDLKQTSLKIPGTTLVHAIKLEHH